MRATRTVLWFGLIGSFVALLACSDGDHSGTRPENDGGSTPEDAGHGPVTGVVEGLVQNTKGRGVGEVTVAVGGKQTTTDKNGVFRVEGVSEGTVQVAVEEKGQSAAQTEVVVRGDQKASVALTTDDTVVVALDNADKGGTVQKDGVKVVVPPMSLKKGDGSNAEGTVDVYLTVADEPQKSAVAPGGMKAKEGTETVQLAPSGLIDVRFYQGDERLTFAGIADLTFPLGPNKFRNGDEVAIWSFDPLTGRWKREGTGTVVREDPDKNGQVNTKANHFTWWAAAEPVVDPTCVSGRLQTQGSSPIAGAQVRALGVDALLSVETQSDTDGSFCLQAPQGAAVVVSALGVGDAALLLWSWDAELGDGAAACGSGDCLVLPTKAPTEYVPMEGGDDAGTDGGLDGGASDAGVDSGMERDASTESDAGQDGGLDASTPDASTPDASTPDASTGTDAGPSPDAGPVTLEICNNGVDDDQNDRLDCDDPQCGPTGIGCTALSFGGENGAVTMGFIDDNLAEGTIELWFNANSLALGTIIDIENCAANTLEVSDGLLFSRMGPCDGPSDSVIQAAVRVATGQWFHVARTWTATGQELYVNGEFAGKAERTANDISTGSMEMAVGSQWGGEPFSPYFSGVIDEVRLWSKALPVAQLVGARDRPLPVPVPNLIGYWRFDEGSGTTANDLSGVDHPGILNGDAQWFPPVAPPDAGTTTTTTTLRP